MHEEPIDIGIPGIESDYVPVKRIGEGTFSSVYKAIDVHGDDYHNAWREGNEDRHVALKQITKTTAPFRILSELKILSELGGCNNVIPIITAFRHKDSVVLVFPHIQYTEFREFLARKTMRDVKAYMKSLLTALEHVHSHGYIHRDVKPSNFLYSMERERGYLIDFGLSQKEQPGKEEEAREKKGKAFFFSSVTSLQAKNRNPPGYLVKDARPAMSATRSGTRGFRAPEVLFRVERQSNAIDVWSAGIIFLTVLSEKYPFFNSREDINGIVEMATIYGHGEMRRAARSYRRVWRSNLDVCPQEKISFREIVKACIGERADAIGDSAYDLLEKMLCLRVDERISASEALRHAFFTEHFRA
jgi:cell division control protein 7